MYFSRFNRVSHILAHKNKILEAYLNIPGLISISAHYTPSLSNAANQGSLSLDHSMCLGRPD